MTLRPQSSPGDVTTQPKRTVRPSAIKCFRAKSVYIAVIKMPLLIYELKGPFLLITNL